MANLFAAHEAWDRHCIKNNIKDPFKALEDLRNEYIEYHHYPEKGLFSVRESKDLGLRDAGPGPFLISVPRR